MLSNALGVSCSPDSDKIFNLCGLALGQMGQCKIPCVHSNCIISLFHRVVFRKISMYRSNYIVAMSRSRTSFFQTEFRLCLPVWCFPSSALYNLFTAGRAFMSAICVVRFCLCDLRAQRLGSCKFHNAHFSCLEEKTCI